MSTPLSDIVTLLDSTLRIAEIRDASVAMNGLQVENNGSVNKVALAVDGSQKSIDDAIAAGADAIWVSNHGGRQLDGAPAAFEVLPEIATRVNKRAPIIFDSGVRRGQHIFKAIASGADVVAIGRPVIYGLALGGWRGVESVFEYLQADLQRVMWLAGVQTVDEIKRIELRPQCMTVRCGEL